MKKLLLAALLLTGCDGRGFENPVDQIERVQKFRKDRITRCHQKYHGRVVTFYKDDTWACVSPDGRWVEWYS